VNSIAADLILCIPPLPAHIHFAQLLPLYITMAHIHGVNMS